MDPMLFGVDGKFVSDVLGTIVLLSLFIERALSVIFEWRIADSGHSSTPALAALLDPAVVTYSTGGDYEHPDPGRP